jgi:FtsP/CotA-like multicopper oxidase with cupredoxin domain/peroxiredoxin
MSQFNAAGSSGRADRESAGRVLGVYLIAVVAMFGSSRDAGVAESRQAAGAGGPTPQRAVDLVNRRAGSAEWNAQNEYRDIPEFRAGERVELTARFAENSVGPFPYYHRSYDGKLVGPTIRVRPGRTLHVRLKNDFPAEANTPAHRDDEPHGFHDTNLHTHGLHVSPSGTSDNVFLDVRPGEHFDFKFEIPDDHPPGTFWYHPHKHGCVALQMTSGMAGALIVEGGLDDAEELRGVEEKILVFQQFIVPAGSSRNGAVQITPADVYSPGPGVFSVPLINGILSPKLVMRPGEVQRWRIVHAGLQETLNLSVVGEGATAGATVPFYEIAVDGLTTGSSDRRTPLELQPGYRSDVLIQAPEKPGKYVLVNGVFDPRRAVKGRLVPNVVLAEVSVEGDEKDMDLPAAESLRKYVPPTLRPIRDEELSGPPRELQLSVREGFTIDGRLFSPRRIDQTVRLGTAEEWRIRSESDRHPFHMHVNPFQVFTVDPKSGESKWVWRDTIFVGHQESVRLRMRFERFSGRTVVHCHNLDHEDRGMMQSLDIVCPDDLKGPRPAGQGMGALPVPVPAWSVTDAGGIEHSPAGYRSSPWVLILHRGISCIHCAQQIAKFGERQAEFSRLGVRILAVAPDQIDPDVVRVLREKGGVTFPLAADPKLKVFQVHGCLDDGPLHGTFVIDAQGMVRWQSVGEEPEMRIEAVLAAVKAAGAVRAAGAGRASE